MSVSTEETNVNKIFQWGVGSVRGFVSPGFGDRLRECFLQAGYWKENRPDVYRFCLERRYSSQRMYAWLRGRTPPHHELIRLAEDFGVSLAWLLLGEEAHRPAQPHDRSNVSNRRKAYGTSFATAS